MKLYNIILFLQFVKTRWNSMANDRGFVKTNVQVHLAHDMIISEFWGISD